VTAAWRRLGRLPALPIVAGFFALAILAGLVLGDASPYVGVALFAMFIVYCVARPAGGMDVFTAAALPGAVATLLHEVAGTPRWLGALLIPFALVMARSADRERAA
jgi:Zn-dependent protease